MLARHLVEDAAVALNTSPGLVEKDFVTHRFYASRAPFKHKDVLRASGYRLSPERRTWWIEADAARVGNEAAWLRKISAAIHPMIDEVTWESRHQ